MKTDNWFEGFREGMEEHRARRPGSLRYESLEPLGRGGQADVYRGWDRELRRPVALKILRESRDLPDEARRRFQREAHVTAGLAHPNVISVHDVTETSDGLCIVMELVEGAPFSRVLGERKQGMRELASLLLGAAEGVAAAHEKGIVHRDLKPANILIAADGTPKVGDFGVAHVVGTQTQLTATGAALGTPLYMAPEQVEGRAGSISPRTDVHALGAILYEIVSGRPPYIGDSPREIFAKILGADPISPRRWNSKISKDLETVMLKSLEKDPRRRYPSAREFSEDLRRTLAGEPISARPPGTVDRVVRWIRRHPAASSVSAVLLVGLATLGTVVAVRRAAARERINKLIRDAERAKREARYGDARNLYAEVKTLDVDSEVWGGKVREMDRLERAKAAHALLTHGHEARTAAERLQSEIVSVEEERTRLLAAIRPHDGREKKQPLWDAEGRLESLRDEWSRKTSESLLNYTRAVGLDPDDAEIQAALAGHYFEEFLRAEAAEDLSRRSLYESLVLLFDDGTLAPRLAHEGTLDLDSRPTGAEVYVFRYEPGGDRRWMPRPYRASERRTRIPNPEATDRTAYELEFSDFNLLGRCPIRDLVLPAASYLLVLRMEGMADVRYPVLLERGGRWDGRVNLYGPERIGEGFVYVPAGPFWSGGADSSIDGGKKRKSVTSDFFISQYEVTSDRYRTFVEEIAVADRPLAEQLIPYEVATGALWLLSPEGKVVYRGSWRDDWPVLGITWGAAEAFCRWETAKVRHQGQRVTFRMPTRAEWEKAARGVDGRTFPWGRHFDFAFTRGALTKAENISPEPVGSYRTDESPYGIRDMGGNAAEWCEDWYDNRENGSKFVCGGSWRFVTPEDFRCGDLNAHAPQSLSAEIGFRLVRVPD